MSDPDPFLTRWSRRKRNAGQIPEEAAHNAAVPKDGPLPTDDRNTEAAPADDQVHAKSESKVAEFDVASLPSLDSIGADTDISAFLKKGVPTEMRHAALRRAWSADPAIRDFKGLQENDWNFNDPNGIPGFGELSPDFDVQKMVRQLFGEPSPDDMALAEQQSSEPEADARHADVDPRETPHNVLKESPASLTHTTVVSGQPDVVHRNRENIAMQDENIATQDDGHNDGASAHTHKRSHGGALPQ